MCSTKELSEFADSCKQKSGKYVWEQILAVSDNGRNIELGQAELIDVGHRVEILGSVWKFTELKTVSKVCLNGWLMRLSEAGH